MKKMIFPILLLGLLTPVTSLSAQVPVCKEPSKPELPPQQADSRDLEMTSREMNVYIKEMSAYRNCLLKLVASADSDLTSVVAGWNHAVDQFKLRRGDLPVESRDERGGK